MTLAELYEEIRTLLREPQLQTAGNPWQYTDADFIPQLRSVLRRLQVHGLAAAVSLTSAGALSGTLTALEGMAAAHYVAATLLSGDLVQRLKDGELGILWKTGADTLDNRGVAKIFNDSAKDYMKAYERYVAMALADAGSANAYFGEQSPYPA